MKKTEILFGLVVAGGESKRMGMDKATLVYLEKPQRFHVYDMLFSGNESLCKMAFISCNHTQTVDISKAYNPIEDLPEYSGIGPVGALLTAFKLYPDNGFLTVGCDYPFLTETELQTFLDSIPEKSIAAAFYNPDGKYEPLLAWYSKEAGKLLKEQFDQKQYSLQHFLKNHNAEKYFPKNELVMKSIDTPAEYDAAKTMLLEQKIYLKNELKQ